MASRLDHLSVVAPSVELGAAYVRSALGVMPGLGRKHPGMATHNLLLALGPRVYLEVIASDPEQAPVARPRWFGMDRVLPQTTPRLAAWVASTDNISRAAVPAIGQVETMWRDVHSWQMAIRADGEPPMGGAGPLLIQRAPGSNPVAALPVSNLEFEALHIEHPEPDEVRSLFAQIELASLPRVTVSRGGKCKLVAEIQTPVGVRLLGEG